MCLSLTRTFSVLVRVVPMCALYGLWDWKQRGEGCQRPSADLSFLLALKDEASRKERTVRRRRDQVVDLLPERAADLRRIVEAGLERPEPPPRKDG